MSNSTPDTWRIVNTAHDPHTLGQFNSVCTVSNGYMGFKGSLAEDRDGYSPVTLVNGVYDELDMFSQIRASNEERRYLDARYFDTAGRSPAVANLPSPLMVRVFIADRELSLTRGEVIRFRQELDLTCGLYTYSLDLRDPAGRTTRIEASRFACMGNPHRAMMRYRVTAVDHDAPIRLVSGITGEVHSNTTRERQFAVTAVQAAADGRCRLEARTPARGIDVQLAVAHTLAAGRPVSVRPVMGHLSAVVEYQFAGQRGEPIVLDRAIGLACSRDAAIGISADAMGEADAAAATGFDAALETQRRIWHDLWTMGDVRIEGDDLAQRYLRFCLFHLLAAAPRHTDTLSVPVKLLTGEYYQGNTFYDTDLYILPYYTFTQPSVARGCINWRWRGLEPGRQIARDLGYTGAKLAWQAGPDGEECLGRWWRFTHTNIHINADVAYSVMQYWMVTGDEGFMRQRGLELLAETARFYASRARGNADGSFSLVDVAGPDEGHCESTDNFYTNVLAARNLVWAADMIERFAAGGTAHAQADEIGRWREVALGLRLLLDEQTGVYEQCEGFYQLERIPQGLLDVRKVWFVTVFPYQALNQPDVVMAMVLLPDEFTPAQRKANWAFYRDKSMNFSSMSFALNAIMAAEMGEMEDAYHNFLVCAGSDIDESLTGRRDTYAGLHGTAAGGAWMAVILGFAGLRCRGDELEFHPNLPSHWESLQFRVVHRGRRLTVTIREGRAHVVPEA